MKRFTKILAACFVCVMMLSMVGNVNAAVSDGFSHWFPWGSGGQTMAYGTNRDSSNFLQVTTGSSSASCKTTYWLYENEDSIRLLAGTVETNGSNFTSGKDYYTGYNGQDVYLKGNVDTMNAVTVNGTYWH
ncbi:hypothetical protein [Beduini massiliensis]|uniref:hypothetical protein n=1 Tax=Beduini massiliensis TaxID=1585974 RepID=UPI00059A7F90|nr:hypothetical protein [Beduini massiliensis]